MIHEPPYPPTLIWPLALLVSTALSGFWVRSLLKVAGESTPEGAEGPGFVIGKLEDVLVVLLVMVDAYTALALIFAAKGLVRKDTGDGHEPYYVLGTLANLTWALTVALAAKYAVGLEA